MRIRYFLIFTCVCLNAQNQKTGIVLDKESYLPIEFVDIYNNYDNTISNEDGKFFFFSNGDSINFSKLGYQKFNTVFNTVKDTIFLQKEPFQLNEVVVTNEKSLLQLVRKNIPKNYMNTSHVEQLFIRSLLRKNDTLTRIQDLTAKLWRKTLLYHGDMEISIKDFEVELTNMRKIGINKDERKTYFTFPTLYGFISSFIAMGIEKEYFDIEEKQLENSTMVKVEFKPKPDIENVDLQGYYFIDKTTYAITSFYMINKFANVPFNKDGALQYRTIFFEKEINFALDKKMKKYYIKNGKSIAKIECTDKTKSYTDFYTLENILATEYLIAETKVKNNTNIGKDMFKLRHPYKAEKWNSQNRLLLTDEMVNFIKRMGAKNQEFKIRSNMK